MHTCKFAFTPENALAPCIPLESGKIASMHLALGVEHYRDTDELKLLLVPSSDERVLRFLAGRDYEDAEEEFLEKRRLAEARLIKETPLIIRSPVCEWLGRGEKALCRRGNTYTNEWGRGNGVGIGDGKHAVLFLLDGADDNLRLRVVDDPDMSLEVNGRKMVVGSSLSLWSGKRDPDAACRFQMNENRTLSPIGSSLVVGIQLGQASLELVFPDDPMMLVFQGEHEMAHRARLVQEARLARKAEDERSMIDALSIVSNIEFRENLRTKGVAAARGAVNSQLVKRALHLINFNLGSGRLDPQIAKGRESSTEIEITSLFNDSLLPKICEALLGSLPAGSSYHQGAGQIALRFPGDHCNGQSEISAEAFMNIRRHWHIDGCASDFSPGASDHYGQIHNFDMLIGVILNDVTEEMSGELCCIKGELYTTVFVCYISRSHVVNNLFFFRIPHKIIGISLSRRSLRKVSYSRPQSFADWRAD
jgi:hypothetical protein